MRHTLAVLTLCLFGFLQSSSAGVGSTDPCRHEKSNADEGKCYAREQARVNAAADSLARKFTSQLRKAASDDAAQGDTIEADLLGKTADALANSEENWKAYRDQQCKAVWYSYTTGSGAGTAYQSCMFELGRRRIRELRLSFADMDFSH